MKMEKNKNPKLEVCYLKKKNELKKKKIVMKRLIDI